MEVLNSIAAYVYTGYTEREVLETIDNTTDWVRTKIAQVERNLNNIGWWLIFILKIICSIFCVCCAVYCQDRANSSNLWLSMYYGSVFFALCFVIAFIIHFS